MDNNEFAIIGDNEHIENLPFLSPASCFKQGMQRLPTEAACEDATATEAAATSLLSNVGGRKGPAADDGVE